MGASRKNAADIKMAVDAVELAFERGYISTFVICTGDSDFTPLVHKSCANSTSVCGVGVEKSTSALLPPACDEFLYYDRLEGVDVRPRPRAGRARSAPHRRSRCPIARWRPHRPRTSRRGTSTRSRARSCRRWPACRAAPAVR
ncbi:NYN domain-containing protein [Micromonospora sp. b486]|uniref:NYN domain-containing protein n=1 Tax=Micromonospora sp. b486 TaxID=3053986 RepID=UPI00259D1C9E|nr:NYN domain-containing protein [Micromonospora sp. b486]MDM4784631.1 NYN domain-containing protein [Micromonospora sp. b486]